MAMVRNWRLEAADRLDNGLFADRPVSCPAIVLPISQQDAFMIVRHLTFECGYSRLEPDVFFV